MTEWQWGVLLEVIALLVLVVGTLHGRAIEKKVKRRYVKIRSGLIVVWLWAWGKRQSAAMREKK